jgi:hypothetical protein
MSIQTEVGDTTVEIRETDRGFEAVEVEDSRSLRYRLVSRSADFFNYRFFEKDPARLTRGEKGITRVLSLFVTIPYYAVAIWGLLILMFFTMAFGWLTMNKEDFDEALGGT